MKLTTKQFGTSKYAAHMRLIWKSYLVGDIERLHSLYRMKGYTQVGSVEKWGFFNKKTAFNF